MNEKDYLRKQKSIMNKGMLPKKSFHIMIIII